MSWGKSKAVYDPITRKRTGYETTEEKDWLVVRHEDLRIVDDDTWTRANLRLSSLAYPTAQSHRRFLLTGKARCTCGALLKAVGEEYRTRYVCTARKLAGPSACPVDEYHRIDWVEGAVLGTVLASVLSAERLDEYAAVFRNEVEAILKEEVRERGRIDRRVAEIDDLQLKSFCTDPVNGLVPARIAKIRAALEDESAELEERRGRLRRPSDFAVALDTLKGVSGDIDRMLEEVPFRPTDAEGVAMAQAVRDAVDTVVVHPADAAGFTRIVVRIDFLQSLRVEGKVAVDMEDGVGRVDLETGFTAAERRRVDRGKEGVAALQAGADDRRHDLTGAEWRIVEPIVRDVDLAEGGALALRNVFDGMILLAKEGGPLARIPTRYGEADAFRRAVKRLVYSGKWDEAVAALRASDAPCLVGAGIERFDTTEFQRRNVGLRPVGSDAERDRAILLKMAKGRPDGDPVAMRCELVARILAGAPIGRIAKALGMSNSSAYHHWDNYKAHGVAVLGPKAGAYKDTLIGDDQIKVLKKVAETGIDPDDVESWITYPILVRVCERRFGVVYSVGGMRLLATRNGFALRPLVAKARRARNLIDETPLPPAAPRRPLPPVRRGTPASKAARRSAARGGDNSQARPAA